MKAFLHKHWPLLAVSAAAVVGVVLYEKSAKAAAPALVVPQNTVQMQPGATTIAPAKGSTVSFVLPVGASWVQGDIEGTALNNLPASGTFSMPFSDDAQVFLQWRDARGTVQSTTINVVPPRS